MVAQLVEFRDGVATLERADGSKVCVPVDRLSSADRDYLAKWESLQNVTCEMLKSTDFDIYFLNTC